MHLPIIVIGSSNTDMVIKVKNLPKPGETLMGGTFLMNPGGKGANQAVAAARLGGKVKFIAKVGNDIFGNRAITQFKKENIDTTAVMVDTNTPSGIALIGVDDNGENSIMVAPGSNMNLSIHEIEDALQNIPSSAIVVLQLEISIAVVEQIVRFFKGKGVRIILNPAPAAVMNQEVFHQLSIITPNETEAELLTGIKVVDLVSAKKSAEYLRSLGVENVVITMGGKGAYVCNAGMSKLIPAPKVKAKDTTAAGDCFNGALAVGLAENMSIEKAVYFACRAASISVSRMGAQSAMPNRKELAMD